MNWKPGDMAIVVASHSDNASVNGKIVGLIKYKGPTTFQDGQINDAWEVRDGFGSCHVSESALRPIPGDDYDGHEKTTWDKLPLECRPKELVRVEI